MAISRISRKKADEPDNLDTGLIDPPLLQKMQDYLEERVYFMII